MKISTKKKGFSIVEEMASIAIIMLVATVCLASILTFTKLIARSGTITKNVSVAQDKLGNLIQNNSSTDVAVTTPGSITMTLNLPLAGTVATAATATTPALLTTPATATQQVKGKMATYIDNSGSGKNKTKLSTFIP